MASSSPHRLGDSFQVNLLIRGIWETILCALCIRPLTKQGPQHKLIKTKHASIKLITPTDVSGSCLALFRVMLVCDNFVYFVKNFINNLLFHKSYTVELQQVILVYSLLRRVDHEFVADRRGKAKPIM